MPNRDVGIMLHGDLAGGVLAYAAGLFDGAPDGSSVDLDASDGKDVAGRLFLSPFKRGKSALKGLGFGIAATTGKQTGAIPSYRSGGQVSLLTILAGITADGTRNRLSPQLSFYSGRFGLMAEYAWSESWVAAMIEAELAVRDRSGKVRISGAKERVEYLNHKTRAGREGGLKSAESRRKTPKQTSSTGGSTPQAVGNPPVPDPSPASAPDPVLSGETETPGMTDLKAKVDAATGDLGKQRARKPKQPSVPVPADWLPSDALALSSDEREQLVRFRDHHRSKGNTFVDIEAAWRNWRRRAPEFAPRPKGAAVPGIRTNMNPM